MEKPFSDNTVSYNRIADRWEELRHSKPVDPIITEFARMLPAGAGVLDIGCGTGYPIAAYLASCGFAVTGIDPAEKMLEKAIAQKLPGARFFHADLFSFETDDMFDAALALDSIFHIPQARQREIYPKVSKLLKPGALFLFTHGRSAGEVHGSMFGEPFSYAALDIDSLGGCLADAGFMIVRETENYSDPITGTRDLIVLAKKK